MASLTGTRFLFFTTSPRSPMKMIPEIELLGSIFEGEKWNETTQIKFMKQLIDSDFFEGKGPSESNLSLGARDRITRAPKALGFVDLKPIIKLTDAGKMLCKAKNKEEVMLRQLLKFQLPSPFHTPSNSEENAFFVKPYLEILRLIYTFGSLTFDEVMLIGLQLMDYRYFDNIVNKIELFRIEKAKYTGEYKKFKAEYTEKVIFDLFDKEISSGNLKVRESREKSLKNFIKTKQSTMRDYTDACYRYLRATGLVSISQRGRSISISKEKISEIEYILNSVPREPVFIYDLEKYKEYLYNPTIPALYNDNEDNTISQILKFSSDYSKEELSKLNLLELKEILFDVNLRRSDSLIKKNVESIKNYEQYQDIINTYDDIRNKNLYDIPLMLEWNTWRAMTMIDGGNIKANLKFDDQGEPLSTALGNMADIICDYDDFCVSVEVTMQSGMRQYESEGEPVSRHLAKLKKETGKPSYCFFIAPTINEACISHFYVLHKTNISYYGGKSIIIPLELNVFQKMVEDSYRASYIPEPKQIENLFKCSEKIASQSVDELDWYNKIKTQALNWLV